MLLAVEVDSPSYRAAVLAPLRALIEREVDVTMISAASEHSTARVASYAWGSGAFEATSKPAVVLSTGNHLQVGKAAHEISQAQGIPHLVVQHGVLTPWSPPAPERAFLLAWTDRDLAYWRGGRAGVTGVTVGSQLLWEASQKGATGALDAVSQTTREVVFLGQLHGAEMRRKDTVRSVRELNARYHLQYRIHPGETDVLSRSQHRYWLSQGVEIVRGQGLTDVRGPVLSHFSTGLLEAANMGLPAFAYSAAPPAWLSSLWDRYELSVWEKDSSATQPVEVVRQPSLVVADVVESML